MADSDTGRERVLAALAAGNQRRQNAGSARQRGEVQVALAVLGDSAPAHYAAAAKLRLAMPAASVAELAAAAGVTKDTMAGRLRRLVELARRAWPSGGVLYQELDRERRRRGLSWGALCAEAGVASAAPRQLALPGRPPDLRDVCRLLGWLGNTEMQPYSSTPDGSGNATAAP